jgi:GT2 family glycosyltransferase
MALSARGAGDDDLAGRHTGTVCALLASHNRREQTLACLQALQASRGLRGLGLSAVLVDDGSTDGTADAVLAAFPWVQVIRADGSLYWCRAMHRAFAHALRESHAHYLWLNDDTVVSPDALVTLLATARERRGALGHPVIVAGSTADQASGRPSYGGGVRAVRWRLTSWQPLPPADRPQRVEVMDGNLVLIPAETAERVGNLDPVFEHAMGDYDYALRAQRQGVQVWLAPGVLAHCAPNPQAGSFHDPQLPTGRRWRALVDRKGLPWRSWLHFTRRHTGPWWPLYFVWPYLRVLLGRPARAAQKG